MRRQFMLLCGSHFSKCSRGGVKFPTGGDGWNRRERGAAAGASRGRPVTLPIKARERLTAMLSGSADPV